jgi:flavorubredoxin
MDTTLTSRALAPLQLAADTWLIPNLLPAGPDAFVPVSSMLIRGAEPVIVDTGAPVHREEWIGAVFGLVDPDDVRWVFVSHDDIDHTGNLEVLLDACPNATVVANFFFCERSAAGGPVPLRRMRWLEPGQAFDVGDRRLHVVRPPLFDGPTTRGLYDEMTGVLWAVDSFACPTPGAVFRIEDVPAPMYDEAFFPFNSMGAPWHEWVDPARFRAHVDAVEALGIEVVASCHGPVLTGPAIADAFQRVRAMAGVPAAASPDQSLLDQILATAVY